MSYEQSSNIPFEQHEVEEYERKRYRGVDQRLVHKRENRILGKAIREMALKSSIALDIPCGYGRFSSLLLEKDYSLVNSDLSFHMVKRATEKENLAHRPVGVVANAKQGLPFKDGAFCLLLSMRFFHHVHKKAERESILREFSRVCSEWVIVSFYQMNRLHSIQRKWRKKIKKSKTRIKMIPRKEFSKEVESNGLKVVKIFPLFRGIHAHHIALLKKG